LYPFPLWGVFTDNKKLTLSDNVYRRLNQVIAKVPLAFSVPRSGDRGWATIGQRIVRIAPARCARSIDSVQASDWQLEINGCVENEI
jgi:hypothetical protein